MKLILLALAILTIDVSARAEELESKDVLAIMAKVPNECALYGACQKGAAGFDRTKDAAEIAAAIAVGASSREEAALGVVYAAYESANRKCAHGDGGKSLGTWQMQRLSETVACTPALAFPIFLERARLSLAHCGTMAEYVSGNCDHGRDKAARRAELVARLAMQE